EARLRAGGARARRPPEVWRVGLQGDAMAWDFETEPEFQEQLDWMDGFVREEVEPLDLFFHDQPHAVYDTGNRLVGQLIKPLQAEVKRRGLWACHLTSDLGGKGYGQLKLAL